MRRSAAALVSCLAVLVPAAAGCGGSSDDPGPAGGTAPPSAVPSSGSAPQSDPERPAGPRSRLTPQTFLTVANTTCGAVAASVPTGPEARDEAEMAIVQRTIATLERLPVPNRLRSGVGHLLDELRRLLALRTARTGHAGQAGGAALDREISAAERRAALTAAATGLPECFNRARAAP